MRKSVLSLLMIATLMLLPSYVMAQDKEAPKASTAQESPTGAMHHDGQKVDADQAKDINKHKEAMAERCKAMQARRDQAMKELQAMDVKLDQKIAAMNGAKGDKKVEAMAAVINEMAAQRKEMREKMHSGGGGMCGMCPMMGKGKGMKGHGMMGRGMPPDCPMMEKQKAASEGASGTDTAPRQMEQPAKP